MTAFAAGGLLGAVPLGILAGWDFAGGVVAGIIAMLGFWLVEREEQRNRALAGLWSVERIGGQYYLTDGDSARLGPYSRADASMTLRAINKLIAEEG